MFYLKKKTIKTLILKQIPKKWTKWKVERRKNSAENPSSKLDVYEIILGVISTDCYSESLTSKVSYIILIT